MWLWTQEIADSVRDAKDGVIRTALITETERSSTSSRDQAELAKFDDYVESFIDPRQPANREPQPGKHED